ncbi:arylsulfatase [Pseudomonas reinekei]|uniref:Arylsulfatase n=1 Tax=Pseudomonas reinekei TaxID=395598 RepID=A0A1H0UB16_PSERE|nr:arylsulfatase [Pseudomonas reinekei]
MTRIRKWLPKLALIATSVMAISATAGAADKPNTLVIFGDDIRQTNISAYSMGVVGYKTPNRSRSACMPMTVIARPGAGIFAK